MRRIYALWEKKKLQHMPIWLETGIHCQLVACAARNSTPLDSWLLTKMCVSPLTREKEATPKDSCKQSDKPCCQAKPQLVARCVLCSQKAAEASALLMHPQFFILPTVSTRLNKATFVLATTFPMRRTNNQTSMLFFNLLHITQQMNRGTGGDNFQRAISFCCISYSCMHVWTTHCRLPWHG